MCETKSSKQNLFTRDVAKMVPPTCRVVSILAARDSITVKVSMWRFKLAVTRQSLSTTDYKEASSRYTAQVTNQGHCRLVYRVRYLNLASLLHVVLYTVTGARSRAQSETSSNADELEMTQTFHERPLASIEMTNKRTTARPWISSGMISFEKNVKSFVHLLASASVW